MPRPIAVVAGVAVAAAAGSWCYALRDRHAPAGFAHVHRAARAPHVAALAVEAAPNTVKLSGMVYDDRQAPVAGVDVVVRADGRESRATTDPDGAWVAAVLPGTYRLYVRGEGVLAVGEAERTRLDADPFGRAAGVPDEGLMPTLTVAGDTPNIELAVVRTATLTGTIWSAIRDERHPLADAIVHARTALDVAGQLPVLGTDTARTDAAGHFALQVAPGEYAIEIAHPHFATETTSGTAVVAGGRTAELEATVERGCQIEGRVVDAAGRPANDGALELGDPSTGGFRPGGRIGGDGSFRFTSSYDAAFTLRAWPWRSGPSPPRTFECPDGSVFTGVTFALPRDVQPDLEGTIVDAAGQPVPLAYLDVAPLDTSAPHQQERASSDGSFRVFDAPAGRYVLTATAPGRGVVAATVSTPAPAARLALGGTGRIAGTVTGIADGSFEVAFEACAGVDRGEPLRVAHEPQIVRVIGGRFAIDGAPACALSLTARWRGIATLFEVAVTADATTIVELELGPPPSKRVHGVVLDDARAPVANARVTARVGERVIDTVTTDADGRFELNAVGGAELSASAGGPLARATVGLANVADEELDVVLSTK